MVLGKVERHEFEYRRHGTQALIAAFDVTTGEVEGVIGNTRSEKDFARFLKALLNSAGPRRAVGYRVRQSQYPPLRVCGSPSRAPLRPQAQTGCQRQVLACSFKKTREAFLRDPTHRVIFHFTPKHASWFNQIEIWFSILVRKLLRRSSFVSKRELRTKIEQFIAYFNKTMVKPFRWTYAGKRLTASVENKSFYFAQQN